jgi:hypothetical protein
MSTSRWLLVATSLLCVVALPARAQKGGRPLNASGTQSLTFGTIFPGVPSAVLRTDAARAGEFQITGQKNADVRITFTLPATLALGGGSVPLAFAAGDGGVSTSGTIGTATAFDPRVPLTATLSQQGRLYIFLGATALASGQSAAGTYAADITISVCYVGDPSC